MSKNQAELAAWSLLGLIVLFSNNVIQFLTNLGWQNAQANFLVVVVAVGLIIYHANIVRAIVRGVK